jgi:Clp amino terminal domain, pathogenicity island component
LVKLLGRRPTDAAQELFAVACREAEQLSFGVGVEHLLLACAVLSPTLAAYGADAEEIRDCIRARERDALASLGISLDSVLGELEEQLGPRLRDGACLPVSPATKRILEVATRRRRHVTPDELLSVLMRESATSRAILRELDVQLDELERHLLLRR